MLKKIKEMVMALGVFGLLTLPVMATATVSAADTTTIPNSVACGTNFEVTTGTCDSSTNTDSTNINRILTLIITVFSAIVGFVAVIMIIVGGVKYITSGGDSGNISGAKNTIIFALVGLVIVALAQVIVHFVLNKVSTAGQ